MADMQSLVNIYLRGETDVNDLAKSYKDTMKQVFSSHHTSAPVQSQRPSTHEFIPTAVASHIRDPIAVALADRNSARASTAADARNKVAVALAEREAERAQRAQ